MLAVEELRIGYRRGVLVLHDLAFRVGKGSILAVLGPNGAGKTTLLRCIGRMIRPWSGAVRVAGADVFRMSAREAAREMGFVAQRNETGRMTVYDAVLLGRKPHLRWRATSEDLRKVDGALRQVGLMHFGLRYLDELSGGELQKVWIARALVQEPKVLLLDEPTSSLDLKNQLDVLESIRYLVREHQLAAVMTMHDLNLAFRFADWLLFVKKGKVAGWGEPSAVRASMVEDVYGVKVDFLRHNGRVVVVTDSVS
ncbi:MAG: ABC transporter ATP-binding protein [Bryobacteraceae bacterium]